MIRIRYYMRTVLTIVVVILFGNNVFAQHTILNGDTLIVDGNAKFWLNQELAFGSGTMPDKSYSYIYEAPNSLQKLISDRKKKLLAPSYRGYKSRVIKFEKEVGHNKKGYDYTILVLEMPNGNKYWCDAKNAYNNHEIVMKTNDSGNGQFAKSETKDEESKKKPDASKPKKKVVKAKETTIF